MKPTPQHSGFRSNLTRPKKKRKRVIGDESIMNLPMDSSANDLTNINELLSSGTKEIQDVLKHECSLIYECKVCRGLFRSIINFVIHKRQYCVTKISAVNHQDLSSKLKQVEALFKTNGTSHDTNNKPMRTTQPPTLSNFYQSLISKTLSGVSPDGKAVANDVLKMQSATVLLDKLETVQPNHIAQAGADASDISNLLKDTSTAVLREDGTIATNVTSLGELYSRQMSDFNTRATTNISQEAVHSVPVNREESRSIKCPKCVKIFIQRSNLYKHLQEVHFTLYKCDQCGKYIHSVRSVLRHLHDVHRFSKTKIIKNFKNKVIASKVVKSVPKHLYRKPPSPCKVSPICVVPKTDPMSCCVKCSNVFKCEDTSDTMCPVCARPPPAPLPSPAKYLMKPPLHSPVSSRSADTASPIPRLRRDSASLSRESGSPIPRLSTEENRNKAGIQVRMNYDKCSSGNTIVSIITKDDDDIPLSPDSSKENAQLNGNIVVTKRKNLDSITQKLLSNKIGNCVPVPVKHPNPVVIEPAEDPNVAMLNGDISQTSKAALYELNEMDQTKVLENGISSVDGNYEEEVQKDIKELSKEVEKNIKELSKKVEKDIKELSKKTEEDVKELSKETEKDIKELSKEVEKDIKELSKKTEKDVKELSKEPEVVKIVEPRRTRQNSVETNRRPSIETRSSLATRSRSNSKQREPTKSSNAVEVSVDPKDENPAGSLKRKRRQRAETSVKKAKVEDKTSETESKDGSDKDEKLDDCDEKNIELDKKTIDDIKAAKEINGHDKQGLLESNMTREKVDEEAGELTNPEKSVKIKLDNSLLADEKVDKLTNSVKNGKGKLDSSVTDKTNKKPNSLRGSLESLAGLSPSSDNENERLFKSLMKEIMDMDTDTCRMCNITLPSKKLLRCHAATRHLGYFRYQCSVQSCGKMYFSHSDAILHARTSHVNHKEDLIRINASTLGLNPALELQARLKEK